MSIDILNPGTITVGHPDLINGNEIIELTPEQFIFYCKCPGYDFFKMWCKEKIKTEKLRSIIRKAKQNDR